MRPLNMREGGVCSTGSKLNRLLVAVLLQLLVLFRDSEVGVLTAISDGEEAIDVRDEVRARALWNSLRGVKKASDSIAFPV